MSRSSSQELSLFRRALRAKASARAAHEAARFFKTGPGEYAEHDQFLGISVPVLRVLSKAHLHLNEETLEELLASPWHEERFVALLILVHRYQKGTDFVKKSVFLFYLKHKKQINNWDLVDVSAHWIVGAHYRVGATSRKLLDELASSDSLWDRRIAVVSTLACIRAGEFQTTLHLARRLVNDPEDLMRKAVGWMLREVGKRDRPLLEQFLKRHASTMPRVMLRYAVEKFSPAERASYLKMGS